MSKFVIGYDNCCKFYNIFIIFKSQKKKHCWRQICGANIKEVTK